MSLANHCKQSWRRKPSGTYDKYRLRRPCLPWPRKLWRFWSRCNCEDVLMDVSQVPVYGRSWSWNGQPVDTWESAEDLWVSTDQTTGWVDQWGKQSMCSPFCSFHRCPNRIRASGSSESPSAWDIYMHVYVSSFPLEQREGTMFPFSFNLTTARPQEMFSLELIPHNSLAAIHRLQNNAGGGRGEGAENPFGFISI